jgi:hypothetical protein
MKRYYKKFQATNPNVQKSSKLQNTMNKKFQATNYKVQIYLIHCNLKFVICNFFVS